MQAVIYVRVSSKEQRDEGFSIPAQLELLMAYAREKGIEVVHVFQEAETAKKAGRTQFNAMVRYLKKHKKVKAILVEKTDRLYRNLEDTVEIKKLGVDLHIVKEWRVLNEDSRSSDKLMHDLNVVIAKNYIDNLSEESSKGMLQKAKQHLYPSSARLGYRNNRELKTIELDEERAPLIRRVFECYGYEGGNLGDATKLAQEIGLVSLKGNRLNRGRIQDMLKSPFYVGDFIWRGELYRGSHPAIIDRALYDRVQELMSGRARPRDRGNHFVFKGLLKCGECGCSITAERKKGKYTYYRCTHAKGHCGLKAMREENLALALGEPLKSLRMDEERAEWLEVMLAQESEQELEAHSREIQRLQKEQEALTRKLDTAYDHLLSGVITEAFWTRKQSELHTRQKHLDAELLRLQQAQSATDSISASRILELTQKAYSLYVAQDPEDQRKILDLVLSNSKMTNEGVMSEFLEPFATIAVGVSEEEEKRLENQPFEERNEIWYPRRDSNPRPPD